MPPIESAFAVALAAGLLGGFGHCVGMCGPLAAAVALGAQGRRSLAPLLLYNLGRMTTYALLGGTVGAAGSIAAVAARLAGVQKAVAVGGGLLVAAFGASMGGWLPRLRRGGGSSPQGARLAATVRTFTGGGGAGACYPLGMLLGLLPCGPVYSVLLSSARAGMEAPSAAAGFLSGFLTMTLFGAGTVPALLLVGRAASLAGERMRGRLYRAAAALMICLGIIFAIRGLRA